MKTLFFFIVLLGFAAPSLAATATPTCSWDHPGVNPYKLEPANALNDYPMDYFVQEKLKSRMRHHDYDDFIEISPTSIKSKTNTYTDLRDMHFGQGSVCRGPVDRSHWKKNDLQRALIYCEGEVCIAVPTVCNNVSLITKVKPTVEDTPVVLSLIEPLGLDPNLLVSEPVFYYDPLINPQYDIACYCENSQYPFFYGFIPNLIVFYNPPSKVISSPVSTVPEPSVAWLLLAGVSLFVILKKRTYLK